MSRFANLADKPKGSFKALRPAEKTVAAPGSAEIGSVATSNPPPSRIGRKAIAAYFSPEMSLAMHVCARKHSLSLQALMAEAFDDVLRKYGASPIGD
jgi:hypothetical protein